MSYDVKIVVGGDNENEDVVASMETGVRVKQALVDLGHTAEIISLTTLFDLAIHGPRPEVVFNAIQGGKVRRIFQGLLEWKRIPFTHASLQSAVIAMDKPLAKKLFVANGVPVPAGIVVSVDEVCSSDPVPRPYIVKPIEGSCSFGVFLIRDEEPYLCRDSWIYGIQCLVEEYIPGREFTVGILEDKSLGIMEIRTPAGFIDWQTKADHKGWEEVVPALISDELKRRMEDVSVRAHRALNCDGPSRVDIRYDDKKDNLCVLEINTCPGLAELSPYPRIAEAAGITYEQLVTRLLDLAFRRQAIADASTS